jgi:acetyl-CoA C-acetyltransferase
MTIQDVYLYDAIRSPRAKSKNGVLSTIAPIDLLVSQLKALRSRNHLETSHLEDVVIGCVTQSLEQGACIARTALIEAKYDECVPGVTLNRFCGSGLEAIFDLSAKIKAGFCDLGIAGGVESMSRVPMGADGGALLDARMALGHGLVPQGISADLLATLHGISRQDCDQFAYESQMKAVNAQRQGLFESAIIPIMDHCDRLVLAKDDYLRTDCTIDSLQSLSPAFEMMGKQFFLDELVKQRYPFISQINHVHTAGNSSGIVDGASLLLIGQAQIGQQLGLTPRAKIKSIVSVGSEPVLMLSGILQATQKALQKANLTLDQIDHFEINEAFAAVPLFLIKQLSIDPKKVNPWGGAIALGHPLGATGAMLVGNALCALEHHQQRFALITLCIGGGMAIAAIIERVSK